MKFNEFSKKEQVVIIKHSAKINNEKFRKEIREIENKILNIRHTIQDGLKNNKKIANFIKVISKAIGGEYIISVDVYETYAYVRINGRGSSRGSFNISTGEKESMIYNLYSTELKKIAELEKEKSRLQNLSSKAYSIWTCDANAIEFITLMNVKDKIGNINASNIDMEKLIEEFLM